MNMVEEPFPTVKRTLHFYSIIHSDDNDKGQGAGKDKSIR